MSEEATSADVQAQQRVVLTAHPLQRVGAFALASLGGAGHPDDLDPTGFDTAIVKLTRHAVAAALIRETKHLKGFWLKCSHSLFPNTPMNHPSNGKKDDPTIEKAVQDWRTMPAESAWPAASCALCGRRAVRFFGKADIPLAASDAYRNTTPRHHEGMALCWPCACSFYALPYGCHLTGGASIAVHSWDDDFLGRTVDAQVYHNQMALEIGSAERRLTGARELAALKALREYERKLRAGVELLVFSNNNKEQALDVRAMDEPLAEWLRRTARGEGRRGYAALVRAHQTANQLGEEGLARNAFRDPHRIVGACARYLTAHVFDDDRAAVPELADLCYFYVHEVMGMDQQELTEIKAAAGRVALLLSDTKTGGRLAAFNASFKEPKRLRSWLQSSAVGWLLRPPANADDAVTEGPLVTTRAYELLFDPSFDGQAWFNRQMFLIAVLEELHRRGWRPEDAKQVAEQINDEADTATERDGEEENS